MPLRHWFFTLVMGFSFTVVNVFFTSETFAPRCRFSCADAVVANSIIAITIGAQFGIAAEVVAAADDGAAYRLLVVALVHGTNLEQEVVEVDGGDDYAKDANAYTDAVRIEVVVQQRGGIECVAVIVHLIIFVEVLVYFLVGDGVGFCEDVADVADGIVKPVLLDAVISFDALAYVVGHFGHHRLLVGDGEVCNDEQGADDAAQDDEFA